MASRRGQILLAVFLCTARFAHAACHRFNSGTVSTRTLCLVLVISLGFLIAVTPFTDSSSRDVSVVLKGIVMRTRFIPAAT